MNPNEPLPPEASRDDDARRDRVIQGHHYDGIREYDNPMPGWWVWLFWLTVVFGILYVPAVHFFDILDTYEEDLAEGLEELAALRAAYEEANPTVVLDEAALMAYTEDPDAVLEGQSIYDRNCMPCHGAAGEGGIGPNLTDAYWIHGNELTDIFEVVTNGVIEKGMTPWGGILDAEQRAKVTAFVHSLVGTDPPNAKAPQGELYDS